MANFIIGKIIDEEGNDFGFRVLNIDDESYKDLSIKEVSDMLRDDLSSFGSMSSGIVNVEEDSSTIAVAGYDTNPVIIDRNGILKSTASHTICGFNPLLSRFLLISYDGIIEKLSLSQIMARADDIGVEKISNSDVIEMVKNTKNEDGPESVYIGEGKIEIPSEYADNDLVCTLYDKANENLSGIIGAYILHTKTRKKDKSLRHYELDNNGNDVGKDDTMNFEIDNSIVNTFFILEQTSKRFITIPVCKAFEPLIRSFKYQDISVEKFKDFLDFITDEVDELELLDLDDEKTISTILGANITSVTIDNTENITYEVNDGQPYLDYERMDATFIVEITEKKKTKELIIQSFPWVIY